MRCFWSEYKPEVESINFLSSVCTALVTSHQYPAAQIQHDIYIVMASWTNFVNRAFGNMGQRSRLYSLS